MPFMLSFPSECLNGQTPAPGQDSGTPASSLCLAHSRAETSPCHRLPAEVRGKGGNLPQNPIPGAFTSCWKLILFKIIFCRLTKFSLWRFGLLVLPICCSNCPLDPHVSTRVDIVKPVSLKLLSRSDQPELKFMSKDSNCWWSLGSVRNVRVGEKMRRHFFCIHLANNVFPSTHEVQKTPQQQECCLHSSQS